MCEDKKCMHSKLSGCKEGLTMICKRRYKKLNLKYSFVDIIGRVNDGV